ncbi:ABC-three component system protein [Agromyces sp. NPDC058136]|uniref:ABC-three component system protein n=1 Tax=Agromyces sp. NPDC058136 TaxID=3346354 RepID=UPI0036DE9B3F
MAYAFEDLSDDQFERLVVQCARKLFGAGVQGFATGPDGGRDARFHGTAERFPSTTAPWQGITVFQAKHTNAINAHFGDGSFSGDSDSSVLTEEIVRIKRLVAKKEVDNYILFANRRLGANASADIVKRIASECRIDPSRLFLVGIEHLGELMHEFPDLPRLAKIDPFEGPLIVSSYEIAEVIYAVSKELGKVTGSAAMAPVHRTSYARKNEINKMSTEFAALLSKRYLVFTRKIDEFLADPSNATEQELYESAVEEFQLKIVAKRGEFQKFDDVYNHLVDLLIARDGVLARNKRLLRALVFYMYWHCDIGEGDDVEADEALSS